MKPHRNPSTNCLPGSALPALACMPPLRGCTTVDVRRTLRPNCTSASCTCISTDCWAPTGPPKDACMGAAATATWSHTAQPKTLNMIPGLPVPGTVTQVADAPRGQAAGPIFSRSRSTARAHECSRQQPHHWQARNFSNSAYRFRPVQSLGKWRVGLETVGLQHQVAGQPVAAAKASRSPVLRTAFKRRLPHEPDRPPRPESLARG